MHPDFQMRGWFGDDAFAGRKTCQDDPIVTVNISGSDVSGVNHTVRSDDVHRIVTDVAAARQMNQRNLGRQLQRERIEGGGLQHLAGIVKPELQCGYVAARWGERGHFTEVVVTVDP